MTNQEAMKLALEALEKDPAPLNAINNAKCFLYSALEQPDDAAWAKHLKEPMSEKRVHESDTMERHVSYVCPQCHWTLEQPGQEPVAWLDVDEYEAYSNSELDEEAKKDLTPLYTAPPQREWVGLTDEEKSDLIGEVFGNIFKAPQKSLSLARAIEAKLKEKNI